MEKKAETVISVRDLSVAYGFETILKDINFEIRRGEIFCILGGSGCGKSVLLRQITGLETPTTGSVEIFGEDLVQAGPGRRMDILRRFGVLFQSGALFNSMTIAENVALPLTLFTKLDKATIDMVVRIKLHQVGLDGYGEHFPVEISGGMKKRAGLARAMAMDPEILFFDEPSSGLDPLTSAGLDLLIKHINSSLGTTMVVVTHDLESIYSIADRVLMLDKSAKGIIAQGTPSELRDSAGSSLVRGFMNRDPEMAGTR